MKRTLDRIVSITTLLALIVAIVLVVKKPAPVAQAPQAPTGIAADAHTVNQSNNGQLFNQRMDQTDPFVRPTQATPQTQPSQPSGGYSAALLAAQNSQSPQGQKGEPRVNSDQISAVVSQMLGSSGAGLTPDSDVGSGAPNIKDQKVTYDGDTVHGQFLTEIAGKDVWITISGRMGQKDGYATFDPTEFKVGNVDVPVALVNPALQRKLAEERDRLKLADPTK
jgi:hypothetical protein